MRILLVALGMTFLGTQDANASHIAGADLTYQCVGNGQYVITLTLYRDCEGIPLGTSEFINFSSLSGGCAPMAGVSLTAVGGPVEVSQLCPAALPNSSCSGGTLYPGMQAQTYISDTLTFPPCSDWVVSWSQCCRNNDVTNLAGASGLNTYINAMINTNLCNSSPVFTTSPTPYFCAGQCYQFNHGAFDVDGDSLIYALTCPLTGAGACAPYQGGFSTQQPLSTNPGPFQFNTSTGQMTFCTTPGLAQQAVVAITVYQIVNGDTVGYVQRDIQMIVLNNANCTSPVNSNDPTVFTGGSFDTTSNTFVVCAGETLQFSLTLSDPDGDTISLDMVNTNLDQVFGPSNWTILFYNNLPPYRPDSALMFIQILAVPANIGVNQFTIGITDNACPIPGDQILGFNLIIPGVEVTASDTTICPGIAQTIQMNANSFSTVGALASGSFDWIQLSGPSVTFSNDTIRNPIVNVPANTTNGQTIVLGVTFTTQPDPVTGTQCVTEDSVTIYLAALPLSLLINASDTSLCPNNQDDTVSLSAAIAGPGIDLINGVYAWTANPASYITDLTNPAINNPDAILSGGPNDQVTYTLTYTYGLCVGSDDITLKWRPGFPIVTTNFDTICPGANAQLMGHLSDSITFTDPTACSTYTVAPITFAPIAGVGTPVALTDDVLSGNLPIGFSFEFYCNTYTQFRISSNGFITFDLATFANGCCTGQLLPDAFDPNNIIAMFWEDINPGAGGTVDYFTTGVAPNRRLVVRFTNVPRFGGSSNVSGQLVLHEGTNYIDIHTTSVSADGPTTQGIENANGTIAVTTPGRNQAIWSATNDAYRFSPGIAFLFGPITYSWTPPFSVSDPTLYNPVASPLGTTMYHLEINEQGCVMQDSVLITVQSVVPAPVITCGTPFNQGTSVLFEWGSAPGGTGWEYSLDFGATWIPAALQDSSLLITGLTNGDCVEILVRATGGASGPCPTNGATYAMCCTTPCPMPNTSTVTNLTCNGTDDGTISIAISGGVLGDHPDYTATLYNLSGTQIGTPISTPNTAVFTGLVPGTYYAYLTDTFGCFTNSDTVVITEPNVLELSLVSTTLTTCFTTADGTASVMGAGGTGAYAWQWDVNAFNQTTMTATGLTAGIYQVVLTDANGCTDTLNVGVYSPFPSAPALTMSSTPSTTCIGNGTASVFSTFNLVGNANNFTYQWSNSSATGPTGTGLTAGVTTLTVTDENGCTVSTNVTITGSPSIDITALNTINPGCGASDGQISAVVTGDAAGYTYQWTANAAGQTTALITGLPIGTYTLIITGLSNGCSDTATVALVNNSALDIVGFNVVNPSCGNTDGEATVLTMGAVGTLVYNWSNTQTTNPATNLGGGPISVTVTDPATNCSDIGDTVLVQYAPTASFASVNNPTCNLSNGSITTMVTGAPGPFTYSWSPNGETTPSISGLAAGTYGCTVTYQGCEIVIPAVTITNDVLQIAITGSNVITCNGAATGFADVTVLNGGTPSFLWSNNATTPNISGLAAGTYTVTATLGSCSVTQSITIINIDLTISPVIGNLGGSTDLVPLGNTTGLNSNLYTNHSNPVYSWSVGTSNVATVADPNANITTATATDTGQTWIYFYAEAGPCSAYDSVLLMVDNLNIAIIDKDTVICNGIPTGYANATVLVGNNVTYLWSTGATTQGISGLAAGVYTVTATSGASTMSASVTITNTSLNVNPWVLNAGTSYAVVETGSSVVINGGVSSNFVTPTYSWTVDSVAVVSVTDPTALQTTATGTALGNTLLYFTATAGACVAVDTIRIKVEQYMGMPTAFTPNGDGINDFFGPTGLQTSTKIVQFKIYNRWGQLMYSDATNYSWDGTYMGVLQPQDYYIYVFEYTPDNGSPVLIRGEFMLIH